MDAYGNHKANAHTVASTYLQKLAYYDGNSNIYVWSMILVCACITAHAQKCEYV